jgi:glutathione S-transferase
MTAHIYVIPISNPSGAGVAMLRLLDHVDRLIADGTIGGAGPNAADFQILSSVRVLLEFQDLSGQLEGRACASAARLVSPDWAGPIPRGLPAVS